MIVIPIVAITGCVTVESGRQLEKDAIFSFTVAADMRENAGPQFQSPEYFLGTCEAIRETGKGAFMVSPGDIDPPEHVFNTVRKVLGEDYPWYPVVGNHESETPEDMAWLRDWGRKNIPSLARKGPENGEETTYSFDFQHAHFIVINEYYDGESDTGTDGDISDPLYNWLQTDLEENTKPIVFVFGHEPIVSIPDYHNGRHRHKGDNLDAHPENNHRFQELLRKHAVIAYICGHTHDYSHAKINGLWQIDAGHSRGLGDPNVPSTFLRVLVGQDASWVEAYRDDGNGGAYTLTQTIALD